MAHRFALVLSIVAVATGCRAAPPPEPKVAKSDHGVTRDNPGGDAAAPVDAALARLLEEPMAQHEDHFGTLTVELPDGALWKRSKFKRFPSRAVYRYGKRRIGLAIVIYTEADGSDAPSACLEPMLRKGREAADAYGVKIGRMHREVRTPESVDSEREPQSTTTPAVVLRTSGELNTLMKGFTYVGALIAYESWPGTCLIFGFAVQAGSDEMLARRVVTRWVEDAAPKLRWDPSLPAAPPFDTR